MRTLILLARLATAASPRPRLSEQDSAALHDRVVDAAFRYQFDWRYIVQKEMRLLRIADRSDSDTAQVERDRMTGLLCYLGAAPRFDVTAHEPMAHFIHSPLRVKHSLCPDWSTPPEPADERKSIDASLTIAGFTPIASDSVRLLRARVLRLLDSAAKAIPGDGLIAGQRVRFHLDQGEVSAARKAATMPACGADFWWCFALLGYAEYAGGDVTRASATFDRARSLMPPSVRCDWDDASALFIYGGKTAYQAIDCARRDSVNARVWWLADPLFLENGNERRTEHYARRVLVELHRALDADEHFDWRDNYQGPSLTEMVMRYGWPTEVRTQERQPQRWHTGNTRSLFLGDTTVMFSRPGGPSAAWCDGRFDFRANSPIADCDPNTGGVLTLGIRYWGPQLHTVPLWQTVLDPFHASDTGWELTAAGAGGANWDTSWWPPEFYRRDAGLLVPLLTQTAFFRRQQTAILVAAMEWDTTGHRAAPAMPMLAGALISTGPSAPLVGGRDTMTARAPRPIVTQMPSGPALLGVEMVPRAGAGAAARTRFGVTVPPPLRALVAPQIGLSDIVLARAATGQEAPTSMVALVPRMYGSTVLHDPHGVAMFWELYGAAAGDTLDVSMRIIQHESANLLERFGALFGFGSTAADSLVVRWTEPRPGDPTATMDGGVSIRPRGLVIDLSALRSGRYTVGLVVRRPGGEVAQTERGFWIRRP